MKNNMMSRCLASVFALVLLLGTVTLASAQPPQGAGAAPMQPQNLAAATTKAKAVSTSWAAATAVGQNYNFGNGMVTTTSGLPGQTQTAITLGSSAAYNMTLEALGIF